MHRVRLPVLRAVTGSPNRNDGLAEMRRNCKRTPRTPDGRPLAEDIAALVARAATTSNIVAIVLFGSGARGSLGDNSDLDLAVLTSDTDGSETTTLRAARRALPPNRAVDLVTAPVAEVAVDKGTDCSWPALMIRDGILVWENGEARPVEEKGRTRWAARVHKVPADAKGWKRERDEWARHAGTEWERGRRIATSKQYPYSTQRVGAFARRAAAAALIGALIDRDRTQQALEAGGKLPALAAAAEIERIPSKRISELSDMRPWRFEGERDITEREAIRSLKTAWAVLKATGNARRQTPPPHKLGPPEHPWNARAVQLAAARGRWWQSAPHKPVR